MEEAVCGTVLSVDSGPGWTGFLPGSQCLHSRNALDALHLGPGQRTDTASVSSALSRRPLAAVIIKGALRTVIALRLLIDLVTRGRVLVEGSHIGAVWCVRVECRVLVWPLSTFVIIDPCALECGTNT